MNRSTRSHYISVCIVGVSLLSAAVTPSAFASTINWTTWSSNTAGAISGLGVTVTYSGQLFGLASGYPSWTPVSTFSGGTVGNPPPSNGGMIRLTGGSTTVDTVAFSTPVVNPVMAIWSLGQGGINANFTFTSSEPFTIESGGPSAEYGGSSIFVCSGNPLAVCGVEGNGTIQFDGTFSSISWTNPVFENYYGFTVGAAGTSTVPEPGTLLLFGSGVLGLGSAVRRRLKLQPSAKVTAGALAPAFLLICRRARRAPPLKALFWP